ncbi:MAG: MarR family transcriptional regulator [Clostridia bacterium]|nr:MarR family transcriptional regulator [Clostridia bacterium]
MIIPIERKAMHKMISAMRKHRQMFDIMREKTGLGRSAHRALMILSDHGDLSQTALAERLEISTAAVAVLLKKLEAEGYILRTANAADSRTNSVELSKRGGEIVGASRKEFDTIDKAVFEGFSEEEIQTLIGFLDRLESNMKNAKEEIK